jgi:hypothetical protein
VKEQSHKDEMTAALRGDFARLRARGVDAIFGAGSRGTDTKAEQPAKTRLGNGRTGLPRFLRRG